MKNKFLLFSIFFCISINSFAQFTNIYQPNGDNTNFGKVTADSLNYYVVNYPSLQLMKIDPNNNATLVTTLTADPFQTMIWNNGKGIYPVAAGSPFKLFDGTTAIDVNSGELPMAGYTLGNVILLDYFHKGNTTYFRTNEKIYKTDFSSVTSIVTLATKQSSAGVGITDMSHTSNSIIYQNIVLGTTGVLRRIDLITGNVITIDSANSFSTFEKGIVYNDEYYYCTSTVGNSKILKVNDAGVLTTFYIENTPTKFIRRIIGATPNGIIAVIADNTGANEYVSIKNGIADALNFGSFSNSIPSNNYYSGVTANSLVYFTALDTNRSIAINNALWVTDGTLSGTKKIKGGSASVFNTSGLDQTLIGSSVTCGDDLYYEGRDGTVDGSLIYVNGTTFAMQALNYLPNSVSIRKTSSGILAIAKPSVSAAAKAVYKVNCAAFTTVENDKVQENLFEVFPNPTNGELTINILNTVGCTVFVYNTLGTIVYQQKINQEVNAIKLDLNAGFYFISIHQNGKVSTKKIIVN